MRRRPGFTLIELMIVIAIIAALSVVLVPALSGIIERARFAACATNLKALGTQLQIYNKDQDGSFPAVHKREDAPQDGESLAILPNKNTTTASATSLYILQGGTMMPFFIPMQEVWPLMVSGGANLGMFHCPNDTRWAARQEYKDAAGNIKGYGWGSPKEYSYGIQWPYAGLTDGEKIVVTNMATPYGKKTEDRLIVFADQNPNGPVGPGKSQHSNHPEIGCNALERGGTVTKWEKASSSKAGMGSDDIYIDQRPVTLPAADNVPDTKFDTVIVPIKPRV